MSINISDFKYPHKTDSELKQSILAYKMVNNKGLTFLGKIYLGIALKFGLPVKLFTKKLFYQFCGGETLSEVIVMARKLSEFKVKTIPDYSIEGVSKSKFFDELEKEICETIYAASENKNITFAVFKPTGLINPLALEFLEDKKYEKDLRDFSIRLDRIFALAHKKNVPVLVDAEDYKYQNSIDKIIFEFIKKYNNKTAIVFTTLQMYRKDRLAYFYELLKYSVEKQVKLGIKFVRGAYMEKERELAEKNKYADPIYPTKEATDQAFDKAIETAIENLNTVSIFCGTHNLKSILHLCDLMQRKSYPNNHQNVWFSQLYGMRDNISFELAKNGYNVAKYLPYGKIRKVMPYLLRRAEENSSINLQAIEELKIMEKELKRRLS
jgi:proline dehydrogenase